MFIQQLCVEYLAQSLTCKRCLQDPGPRGPSPHFLQIPLCCMMMGTSPTTPRSPISTSACHGGATLPGLITALLAVPCSLALVPDLRLFLMCCTRVCTLCTLPHMAPVICFFCARLNTFLRMGGNTLKAFTWRPPKPGLDEHSQSRPFPPFSPKEVLLV